MEKQQKKIVSGRHLHRDEIKAINGGGKKAHTTHYYCGTDYETYCYPSLAQCEENCCWPLFCTSHRTGQCV
jgi:hypothetical protein